MQVGVVSEIKNHEYRVALTPGGAAELVRRGHDVLVQAGAGQGAQFADGEYSDAGAIIVQRASDVWADSELLLKVKEPIAAEYDQLRADQVLFTYLHLAADADGTQAILDSRTTAIAYETVQEADGSLPLLAPMSEVAGRLATQVGAYHLMKPNGGRGVLLGGVPGVAGANVLVIGGGVSGFHAASMAVGLGADVTILDLSANRLRQLDAHFNGRVKTVVSTGHEIQQRLLDADLVIGAVLVPGAKAPKLVSNADVATMKAGSVLVDIAIDQGGCFEDSRATTHQDPTFEVHNSIFYCVANMPGAVARTSTFALTNVTLPYVLKLADLGWQHALRRDPALALGLNAHAGVLANAQVGEALGISAESPSALVGS
ncbi:alanine dehydrogenase [Nocardioides sp. LS1]|uniref:alanine dehydrogenase n=1 Tax=Nocardioides sp. LS1 TaxID=1027620 RepID=UPI000F6275E0|nr:alanine dehydrogenase [Nocardioides sp. LS1]GCD88072.1 alanine dehydrogenase [Nocardioides sp. LS1]